MEKGRGTLAGIGIKGWAWGEWPKTMKRFGFAGKIYLSHHRVIGHRAAPTYLLRGEGL